MAIAIQTDAELVAHAEPSAISHHPSAISIVIPAYNEARGIRGVLEKLNEWRDRWFEIIVVDDGSNDGTGEIASAAGARVIRHPRNKGYGASLKTGIRAATTEIVVTLDSDGQHDPEDIARLLDMLEGNDMVVGARGRDSHVPALRRPGKWILNLVANYLAEAEIRDLNSGFRALRRETVRKFLHILPNGFSFSTTLTLALFKEGFNVAYVPIVATPRVGTSTVNPIRDGINAILLIIRVIMLFDPLKVFVPVSLVLFVIALSYAIADMLIKQHLNIPTGAVILFVSSLIIFMFGILADQVSAMRREKNE